MTGAVNMAGDWFAPARGEERAVTCSSAVAHTTERYEPCCAAPQTLTNTITATRGSTTSGSSVPQYAAVQHGHLCTTIVRSCSCARWATRARSRAAPHIVLNDSEKFGLWSNAYCCLPALNRSCGAFTLGRNYTTSSIWSGSSSWP